MIHTHVRFFWVLEHNDPLGDTLAVMVHLDPVFLPHLDLFELLSLITHEIVTFLFTFICNQVDRELVTLTRYIKLTFLFSRFGFA